MFAKRSEKPYKYLMSRFVFSRSGKSKNVIMYGSSAMATPKRLSKPRAEISLKCALR